MILRRRKVFALVGCLVLGMVLAAGIHILAAELQDGGLAVDPNAVTGLMPGVEREQRLAELQEQLDESMIAFSVNTNPEFADGASEGNLLIENPEHNAKLLVAEIYLDDTQELVYQSKGIPPGAYIGAAKLDKILAQGDYPATVYLKGYTIEGERFIGQVGAKVELHIEN